MCTSSGDEIDDCFATAVSRICTHTHTHPHVYSNANVIDNKLYRYNELSRVRWERTDRQRRLIRIPQLDLMSRCRFFVTFYVYTEGENDISLCK